ncbi:MAG: ArsA family ATPase [Candidatus Hodarchaeota archaeon]
MLLIPNTFQKNSSGPPAFFITGKGGVGKTSTSEALALVLERMGYKVLLVSADPAHSLYDGLGMNVDDHGFHLVPGCKNVIAHEIEVSPVDAVNSEESDVLTGLANVYNVIHSKKLDIDIVVVDCAPSGHMLRTLSYPFFMNDRLEKTYLMLSRMARILGFNPAKLPSPKQLLESKMKYMRIMNFLRDETACTVVLVTIPEKMSFLETERDFRRLRELRAPVSNVIINKVYNGNGRRVDGSTCDTCNLRERMEGRVIGEIEASFKGVPITRIPLFEREVVGLDAIKEIGACLVE